MSSKFFPNFESLIFQTDSYKLGHIHQYPELTQYIYSNFTFRGSRILGQLAVVGFGLQFFLQYYMVDKAEETFFSIDKDKMLKAYQDFLDSYLGPNDIGVDHIADLHDLGYMPLEFRARPEGSLINLRTPYYTVENTHPNFGWLTNYFETIQANLWLPCTSATIAYRYRRLLDEAAIRQDGPLDFVSWQGHDFSMRGMEDPQAAAISGAGHLLSFTGSDTLPASLLLREYYGCEDDYLLAGSVAATEHSVVCAGGRGKELRTLGRLITEIHKDGILSYVADTWNIWDLILITLVELKDTILSRNGKLVIRPDSGDPVKIICGDPNAKYGSPEYFGVVELLWQIFGATTTSQGLRILDSHIGVIYGDSITEDRCKAIIEGLEANGFASANMVFGIGSFTYQHNTRDTFGTAMKATNAVIDGVEYMLEKDPITDDGLKKSATGRLVVNEDGTLTDGLSYDEWVNTPSLLELIWKDGEFVKKYTVEQIRNNLHPIGT